MFKIKYLLTVFCGMVLFSSVSEARVCFLVGSDDEEGCLTASYDIESEKCPGFTLCEHPQKRAPVCVDGNDNYYKPENCCSNSEFYEPCDGDGMVCDGAVCISSGPSGEDVVWCEKGQCKCDSSYSETCDPSQGLEGVGDSCNGKYRSCRCSSSYYKCDAAAIGSGTSCRDDTGVLHSACICPATGDGGWVSNPDECCGGYSETCTNRPSGSTVYKCRTASLPDCVCGYNFNPDKQSCVNGCTDSSYNYHGEMPLNATCQDAVAGLKEGTICANNCKCNDGYWDFVETCLQQDDDICQRLGYTESSCSGDWIACPYDVTAKRCLK